MSVFMALPADPANMRFSRLVERLYEVARSAGYTKGEALTKMEDDLSKWVEAHIIRRQTRTVGHELP